MFHLQILNLASCPCVVPLNDFWSSWLAVMKFITNFMHTHETSGTFTVLLIITGVTDVYAAVVGGKLYWKMRRPRKVCMDVDNYTTGTDYEHPIPYTHPQLLFQFFQCVNYKHDLGEGGRYLMV